MTSEWTTQKGKANGWGLIAYYPDKLEGLKIKTPWMILQEGTNINNWILQ